MRRQQYFYLPATDDGFHLYVNPMPIKNIEFHWVLATDTGARQEAARRTDNAFYMIRDTRIGEGPGHRSRWKREWSWGTIDNIEQWADSQEEAFDNWNNAARQKGYSI